MGLAADRSSARRRRSLLSLAAGLGCLALPAWSQSTVPGAEVISIDAAETTVVEVDGGEPLPTKPLRINTGLVTIESDQQSSDNITGVITASGNVRIVHPDRGLMATGRQAQYFSKEQRIVLSGDVDVIQAGGRSLRAEQVTVLLDQQRTVAIPTPGQQVISRIALTGEGDGDTP